MWINARTSNGQRLALASFQWRDVSRMLKAIHAQEDRKAASEKMPAVITDLRAMKRVKAAEQRLALVFTRIELAVSRSLLSGFDFHGMLDFAVCRPQDASGLIQRLYLGIGIERSELRRRCLLLDGVPGRREFALQRLETLRGKSTQCLYDLFGVCHVFHTT